MIENLLKSIGWCESRKRPSEARKSTAFVGGLARRNRSSVSVIHLATHHQFHYLSSHQLTAQVKTSTSLHCHCRCHWLLARTAWHLTSTMTFAFTDRFRTRSQAVARIADRTASQHLRGSRDISYWWFFGTVSLSPAVFDWGIDKLWLRSGKWTRSVMSSECNSCLMVWCKPLSYFRITSCFYRVLSTSTTIYGLHRSVAVLR